MIIISDKKSFCLRVLFLLLMINGITSCKTENKKKTDWEKYGLKVKVYSLKERHYLAKMEFGNPVKCSNKLYTGNETCGLDFDTIIPNMSMILGPLGEEANEDLIFYKNGKIYSEVHFNNKGIMWWECNNYDKKNRLIKNVSIEQVDSIDKNGLVYFKNNSKSEDSIVYKGNESYLFHQDKYSPKPYMWVFSKYDDNDNIIEEIRYLPSKQKGNRRVYQYDSLGREISNICYDSGNIIDQKITKYENNVIVTNVRGFQTTVTYIDSNFKHKISEVNSYGPQTRQTWQYDNKGNVIDWQGLQGSYKFKYNYDKEGNWINRTKYNSKDNSPEEITEREIEYYESIDHLYIKVALTFLFEYSALLVLAASVIILLVFMSFLLLRPLKFRIKKNDKTTKYLTFAIASLMWLITGAIFGSAFYRLQELINVLACIIFFIMYLLIVALMIYDYLTDEHVLTGIRYKINSNDYRLVNKIEVEQNSNELTKNSLINYYSLQCSFFGFISFASYLFYVHYTGNNPIDYHGLFLRATIGTDFLYMLTCIIGGGLLWYLIKWSFNKFKKDDYKSNNLSIIKGLKFPF